MEHLHIIENESLRIIVADHGAELVSVWDKDSGSERIWTADPAVWNRHAPILFPFVGKVADGKYRVNGKEYRMKTQHGFARDLDFSCADETACSVTHVLEASDHTREIYPFDFRLTVRHSLCENQVRKLRVDWAVENTGNERMYYSIGGHPGFLIPENVRKEDCLICFPGRESLRYFGVNASGFALPENRHDLICRDGKVCYQEDIPDTWIFDNQEIRTVGIALPDGTPFITMDCGQFPMLAVWANPKGSFICLEPWFGRTDDEGFQGSLQQKTGMEILEIRQKKEISYTIEFHG